MRKIFLGCTASVMLAALTTTTSTARVYSGGISPHMDDIFTEEPIEIQKKIKPYYKEAGIDVYLGTGTLEVEVIDRSSGRPLDEIEVHFVKKYGLIRTPKQTEGLGYTDELGIYRIETIPKGKYFVEVSANDGSKYSLESEEIEIISGELTVIRFELGPKINGIKFKGE